MAVKSPYHAQLWKEYRKDFPEAQMVTKTIKKNATKRTYKNLTYVNMERFLKSQDNADQLLKEFKVKKEAAAIQQNPYRAVLAWFLAKFPKYDEYKEFFTEQDTDGEKASANVTLMKSATPAA